MDNLKSLMDKKQYSLVVKVTENAKDINDLFYRVSAFLALGKPEESLKVIDDNKDVLEHNLKILIKIHLEILCILGKFDDAYSKLKYYENLPYVSQEVEEILREMPNYIRQEEKRSYASTNYSDAQIGKLLCSKDQYEVLMGLDLIRDRDITPYNSIISNVMVNFAKQSVRSFALLLLVQKKVDRVYKFNHCGEVINVNPSELIPPFIGDEFNNLVRELDASFKNPSLSENAVQILSSHLLYIYPQYIEYDDPCLIEALYQLASSYLKSETDEDLDTRCFNLNLSKDKVEKYIEEISHSLEDF